MISDLFKNENCEPYIIAEISQNHDGSLGQAHAFIDAVADCGVDAVKFQTHIAKEESTINEPFRVNFSYEDKNRYDYWKRMEFSKDQWLGLYNHAKERGIDFLSSPFSNQALSMLDEIGIPAWKFGSGEVFNDILLDKAIKTKKPIILSTGLSTVEDIKHQIEKIEDNGNDFIVMHCTTAYPSKPEEISINRINELKEKFGDKIGLSDHSATIFPSLSSITLGAKVIEVHVTMSPYMFGPDVKASVTLEQLREIVEGAKFIHTMLNHPGDRNTLTKDAIDLKRMFAKSIYIKGEVNIGEILTEDNISIKKPCIGMEAKEYYNVLGKRVKRHLNEDEPLMQNDIMDE